MWSFSNSCGIAIKKQLRARPGALPLDRAEAVTRKRAPHDGPRPHYLITVADDFGLTPSVNEAVELATNNGILTSASLMVGSPHAADAIIRAKRTPKLHVGLHLVVIEGTPILPPDQIPDLVDCNGQFPSHQRKLGIDYFFKPRIRRQLAAEIRAQFDAFRATGLTLDHANAHKHMHLHPTVGRMMIDIGRDYGLRAVRIPAETPVIGGPTQNLGDRALRAWSAILRRQVAKAGMLANDHIAGLGWTGHMTQQRTQALLNALSPGLTEMYFHPATRPDSRLYALMPDYEHEAEFAALTRVVLPENITLTSYGQRQQA